MSSDKKIIAVVRSTGMQGGSVVHSLIANGTFTVCALMHKVDAKGAQKLKAAGAEVVAADLEDTESLKKAFKGTYGIFGVTGEIFNHMRGVYSTGLTIFFSCQAVRLYHLGIERAVDNLCTTSSLELVLWHQEIRSSKGP